MRGTFRPLRSGCRPPARGSPCSPLPSARPRSGLRRALSVGSPSGSLAPPIGPGRARRLGPLLPPAALAAPPAAASGGSGSLAPPLLLWVALRAAAGSLWSPLGPSGLPAASAGGSLRRGPPPASGLRPAALRLPSGLRPGA